MASITLSKLNKHYGALHHAVKDVDLTIADKTLGPIVRRCVAMPFGLPAFPNVNAWLEKLNARPAFKKAHAEQIAQFEASDRTRAAKTQ